MGRSIFLDFAKKVIFHFFRIFLSVLEVRYIHEKSMRPRFFVFCSYLPKKLSGDVLAPSDPSLDPPRVFFLASDLGKML